MEKSIFFLYLVTNNRKLSYKVIPLIIISKNTTELGINLTKVVKEPYMKNYITMLTEILEEIKWREISCSWISRFDIVKMSILPK